MMTDTHRYPTFIDDNVRQIYMLNVIVVSPCLTNYARISSERVASSHKSARSWFIYSQPSNPPPHPRPKILHLQLTNPPHLGDRRTQVGKEEYNKVAEEPVGDSQLRIEVHVSSQEDAG